MANNSQNSTSSTCLFLQLYSIPTIPQNEAFVIFIVILNSIVVLLSSLSNLLVITTILRTPCLRRPYYILILGLAVSDFGVAIIGQPCYCMLLMAELRNTLDSFCLCGWIYFYTTAILSFTSFYLLTCIAADRFLAINLHLRYQEIITNARYSVLVAVIYVFCLVTGIAAIVIADDVTFRYYSYCIFGLFILMIILTLYFFVRISVVIRRHTAQIQAQQESTQLNATDMPRYRKSLNTMRYIVGAYCICYTPHVVTFVVLLRFVNVKSEAFLYFAVVCDTIWMANGLVNPIIYCLRIKEIRDAVDRLVQRFSTLYTSS